jgi:hypothetical protein
MAFKKQKRQLLGIAPYENGTAAGTSLGFGGGATPKAPAKATGGSDGISINVSKGAAGADPTASTGNPWKVVGADMETGEAVFKFDPSVGGAAAGGGAPAAPKTAKAGGGAAKAGGGGGY